MTWTPQREAFRAILAGDRCVTTVCVSDPLGARMAQSLGEPAKAQLISIDEGLARGGDTAGCRQDASPAVIKELAGEAKFAAFMNRFLN